MTLEEKQLREIQNRVKKYLSECTVLVKQKAVDVDFFLKNADDSLQSAKCLFDVSAKHDYAGYENINGFLWVINASYYSMFYMARALLGHEGIKLKTELSIHLLVFDVLVHFFYITGKLQKQLVEHYAQAKEEAAELLGRQKADELVQDYLYEKEKRATFTYETGIFAMQSKAKTSLDRSIKFNLEIRRIIKS